MRPLILSKALAVLSIAAGLLNVSNAISKSKTSLITRVFQDYDPDIAPQLEENSRIPVEMKVLNVYPEFDEEFHKLTVQWQLVLRWTDPRLKWNPNDYGGVKMISDIDIDMKSLKLWMPMYFAFSVKSDPFMKCTETDISNKGQVKCYSSFVSSTGRCNSKSKDSYQIDDVTCYFLMNGRNISHLTCLDDKKNHCFSVDKADQKWRYKSSVLRNYRWPNLFDDDYWGWEVNMKRVQPRATLLYIPVITLACLVLLQWLLILNYRERTFLNVSLLFAAFTLLSLFHSMPAVQFGRGRKLLRLSSTVVLLNCLVMLVNVAIPNFLYGFVSQAASTSLSETLTRLRLGVFLPTLIKFPGGEADPRIVVNVTIDRVMFVLSGVVFAIVCFVP